VLVKDEAASERNKLLALKNIQLEAEIQKLKSQPQSLDFLMDLENKKDLRIAELEEQLDSVKSETEAKVAALAEEYEKKLSQSQAVASMKQIIKDKNAMINELRSKLDKYE
jgi:CHASE3 domain sensor protein